MPWLLATAFAADDAVCSTWTPSALVTEVEKMPAKEASGLAVIADGFLTHDDSSGAASLYQFDLLGNYLREITIEGATNTDWEDIAVGGCDEGYQGECVFIADIGDNDGVRDHVTIWRAPVADADAYTATACDLEYEDGEAHDAEALLLFPDLSVRIVTKTDGKAAVYRSDSLTCDGTVQTLIKETTLDLGEPISGGAVSHDGLNVALRSNEHGWVWEADCGIDWSATPADLLFVGEEQGEAMDFADDGSMYSVSEGKNFELHQLPCSDTRSPVCADCGCSAQPASATASVGAALATAFASLAAGRRRRRAG